jgi:hypothetical protein
VALYKQKGSNIYWYEFQFAGTRYRESAKTTSKQVAGERMTSTLESGVPLDTVAELLGWSASTMHSMSKRYRHITDTRMRAAVAVLGRKDAS